MNDVLIEELVGYVNSNVKRKQVVDVLEKNGSESLDHLSKVTRIPRLSLQKIMEEMASKEIVKLEDGKYMLTETGDQVVIVSRSAKGGKDSGSGKLFKATYGDGRL